MCTTGTRVYLRPPAPRPARPAADPACSGRHKRRGHPRPIPTSPGGGEHAQPCYGRRLRSECSNPAAAMCTSIAWFHGDCGDDRGDATPSRDALDGASVGSPGAPRVSLRQACAARGESGVSCGVWPLRLGWAVDEALMCRNECTGGTSGLASTRGSGGTRAGRGGGAARGRSHLELQAQKLTLSNTNELDWRATLAQFVSKLVCPVD